MEGGRRLDSTERSNGHEPESLAKSTAANPAAPGGADDGLDLNDTPNRRHVEAMDEPVESRANLPKPLPREPTGGPANKSHGSHLISVGIPASRSETEGTTEGSFIEDDEHGSHRRPADGLARPESPRQHNRGIDSQAAGSAHNTSTTSDSLRRSKSASVRDKRFDSFKTRSGRLERQLTTLRGKPLEEEAEISGVFSNEIAALPSVERYFDALEGPELDVLKPSEESALPADKLWPFLLRFPISSFGICLGVGSQAILWKTLATSSSTKFLHISQSVNLVLWCIALLLMVSVFFTYLLKVLFYFEAVRREYCHPVRVNFFFAPWIACLFLAIGVPPSIAGNLRAAIWYVLMAPILCLELKIYGQWMLGGQRRLSKVANPSNHLSIVGNFVGALLGASMGLKEGPIFFFAVGLAHYVVLFVTLYQRLPTNETLPKELHPVFFLFVAAPSVACMAWANIRGDFDYGSRIAYFTAMFLYFSLAVRANFFRGFRFSLAWWAYTFPMTGAAIATIRYSTEVNNPVTQIFSVALSAISSFTVSALLVTTIIHAFFLRDLFPNDISIAITETRPKLSNKRIGLIWGGPYKTERETSVAIDIRG